MSKNGLILLKPTTVDKTGGSSTATISANGSVEFSACTSLRLNGVFSADYDNYLIIIRSVSSGNIDVRCRLSLSSADETGTNYTKQQLYASATAVGAARSLSQDQMDIGVLGSTNMSGNVVWFYGPALAQPTAVRSISGNAVAGVYLIDEVCTHSLATAYDGFNFYDNGLNDPMTGRIAVYGMRK